jgi:hypothetical protein
MRGNRSQVTHTVAYWYAPRAPVTLRRQRFPCDLHDIPKETTVR